MNQQSFKYPSRADMLTLLKQRERGAARAVPAAGNTMMPHATCLNIPVCGPR